MLQKSDFLPALEFIPMQKNAKVRIYSNARSLGFNPMQ
jgi:hypothetical protein